MKKQVLSSTLVSLRKVTTTEGVDVIAAIVKEGDLHTKSTVRSYITALSGAELAVAHAFSELEQQNLSIINGATITWERTTYDPGESWTRSDGTAVMNEDETQVDHIVEIDLQPIGLKLLLDYIEVKELEPEGFMAKLLEKGFGIQL